MHRRQAIRLITATTALGVVAGCGDFDTAPPARSRAIPDDIVETLEGTAIFTTLVDAVEASGLAPTLHGEGPFTLLAPTDEAFAALPEGSVEALLKPENREELATILSYHVVKGQIAAEDLPGRADGVRSIEGRHLSFGGTGDGLTVNDAQITTTNLRATNGFIHVTDRVLLPS